MTRKFRLYVKKRQYTRKQERTVETLPLVPHAELADGLVVSLPLSLISALPPAPLSVPPLTQHRPTDTGQVAELLCSPLSLISAPPLASVSTLPPTQLKPADTEQVVELVVSLPISFFSALTPADLGELHSRLIRLRALPSGWCDTTAGTEQITFCRIVRSLAAALPRVDVTLVVEANLAWKVYFHDQRLEVDHCPTLAGMPPTVRSPADVANLLSVVDNSQVCIGNPDEKFLPIVQRHQGQLLDPTGKLVVTFFISQ